MGHRHLGAVKEEGLVGASSRQSGGEKRETLLRSSTTKGRSKKEQELEEQVGRELVRGDGEKSQRLCRACSGKPTCPRGKIF